MKQSRPVHPSEQWQCSLLAEKILWEEKKRTGLPSKVQVNASFKETVPENKGMSDEEIRFFTNKRAVNGWCW